MGQKGAALTTSLSLAGRYLVLTPFDDTRGVSRKVEDEDTRKKLKGLASSLELPDGLRRHRAHQRPRPDQEHAAARPRGAAAAVEAGADRGHAGQGDAPPLQRPGPDRCRRCATSSTPRSRRCWSTTTRPSSAPRSTCSAFMPRSQDAPGALWRAHAAVLSRYDVEPQIDRIYERRVPLPSGGSIVIDPTEALTAIDVNSGRSTRAATQEETALQHQPRGGARGGPPAPPARHRRPRRRRLHRHARAEEPAQGREGAARRDEGRQGALDRRPDLAPTACSRSTASASSRRCSCAPTAPAPPAAASGRLASEEMVGLALLRRIEARAATGTIQGGPHRPPPRARRRAAEQPPARAGRPRDRVRHQDRDHRRRRPPPAEEKIEWQKRRSPCRRRSPSGRDHLPALGPRLARRRGRRRGRGLRRGGRGPRRGERPGRERRGGSRREETPPAPRRAQAEEEGGPRRERQRRRPRYRRQRPGRPGSPGEDAPADTYIRPSCEGPAFADEPADLFDEDDDEEDDDDLEEGVETVNADGTVAAAGAPGTKKRRRRRRRRK